MKTTETNAFSRYVGLAASLAVAAFLLFPGLNGFGMWEPDESGRADTVRALTEGRSLPDSADKGPLVAERLSALGARLGGEGDGAARAPLALLAFLTVAALYLLLVPLGGPRLATVASLALASSPALLFNGRQLTAGMPVLCGEVLAVGGLALLAFGQGRATAVWGCLAGIAGLALASLASGLVMGAVVPAATVFFALAMGGDLPGLFSSKRQVPVRRRLAMLATLAVTIVGATVFACAALSSNDIPALTGGLAHAALKQRTLEYALEQIAYGWFPWSALVPLTLAGVMLDPADGEEPGEQSLRFVAVAGVTLTYLGQSLFTVLHGPAPCFAAWPMAVGAALALRHLERSPEPRRFLGIVAVALYAMLLRDFAQRPETLLTAYGSEGLSIPTEFKPVLDAAKFSAPFAIMLIAAGFLGAGVRKSLWRSARATALAPAAALAFGGYITMALVPSLSTQVSSKHAVDAYQRFRRANEPLAVYGRGAAATDAVRLDTKDDLLKWLSRPERAFAMFPPRELATIDRAYRERHGRHVFVLDAASDRFVLAASKAMPDEKDQNPLGVFVRSAAFAPSPSHPLDINMEDKVTLLGWDFASASGEKKLKKGEAFTLTTYWRCDAPIGAAFKFFVHMDGAGSRINGDHDPIGGMYPTTEWRAADYLKDVYKGKVPLYQGDGRYTVWTGLFKGGQRLKIDSDAGGDSTRARLGTLELD
ncbi:MAG: hypothetical protein PHU25_18450 [Deltaproteobacteria bacterium]|nr:hypothetical protein [Deltaproteobacteria bacterium]